MSSPGIDSENRIKKTILLRYPFNRLEESSRQLIIHKTLRGNNKRYKALMAMDEVIDYVTLDEESGKRVWEIKDFDQDGMIFIRKDLIEAFQKIFHGDANGWMVNKPNEKIPALKYLSPPEGGFDLKNDIVWIRKPVPFKQVWADRPVPYQVMIAGFGYKVQQVLPNGFPTTETIPMIDWNDPDIDGVMTETIPVGVFHEWFELGWHEVKPTLTMIEKTIAKTLEGRGIKEAEESGVTIAKMMSDSGGDKSGAFEI